MPLSEEQEQVLKEIINTCLNQLYQNDHRLFSLNGLEQSAAFRFGIYLHEAIKEVEWLEDLHLDMEYNKNGQDKKATSRREKGTQPDLILHSRGNNQSNTLIIEFKGVWNRKGLAADYIKLEDFTSLEGAYKYGIGVSVYFYPEGWGVAYFKGGKELTLQN